VQRFKNILVVVDNTDHDVALERAVALSKRSQARLTVANVVEEAPYYVRKLATSTEALAERQAGIIEVQRHRLYQRIVPIRIELLLTFLSVPVLGVLVARRREVIGGVLTILDAIGLGSFVYSVVEDNKLL